MPSTAVPVLTEAEKAIIEAFFKLLKEKPALANGSANIWVENDGVCDECGTLTAAADNTYENHALWKHKGKWVCRDCCEKHCDSDEE